MQRREFLQSLGWAVAGIVAGGGLSGAAQALGHSSGLRLVCLADAHLKDGNDRRGEARALARAVAEIRAMQPRPDLVLFAGDLAHDGDPKALALGREMLSDLAAPVSMVRGEGDGLEGAPWRRLFGDPWFIRTHGGVNILGLHTYPGATPHGPAFEMGKNQIAWIAQELSRLDPAAPLIVLSHAPLTPIFRPWGQWTRDAHRVAGLLSPFPQAVYFHGHVHQAVPSSQFPVPSCQFSVASCQFPVPSSKLPGTGINGGLYLLTENRKSKTENHLSLPATSWPLPSPLQGTPAALGPGQGPQGCGWAIVSLRPPSWQFQPHLWPA